MKFIKSNMCHFIRSPSTIFEVKA